MSYILDALKKAEADRDPDSRTTLAIEQHERRRHRTLIYVALTALIANAVIILWLLMPDSDEPGAAPQVVTPASPNHPASATQEAKMAEKAIDAPTTPSDRTSQVTSPADPVAVESTPTTLTGMPQSARRRFPDLSFSTHVYADDPALRAIVVNGTRLTEGDVLGVLVVQEITEDGAVFAFDNYLVSIPVLENWN